MTVPIVLSPALPSEFLSYILNNHVYPTTLIICCSRNDFLALFAQETTRQSSPEDTRLDTRRQESPHESNPAHQCHDGLSGADADAAMKKRAQLLSSFLYQVATSRHIRVVYVPTVTHLRAYLSVFSPDDSRVPVPPASVSASALAGKYAECEPCIVFYGLLQLHRDTSEWSAQGLSTTISALVGLAHRLSWQTLLIEPEATSAGTRRTSLEEILRDMVPILSGGARKLGPDTEDGAWTGRTVEVGRILGRWSRFQRASWDVTDDP